MVTSDLQLSGVGIVVTRPEKQAGPLCDKLQALGARVIHFPVLEIVPPVDVSAVRAGLNELSAYDTAIFISPNAVESAVSLAVPALTLPASLALFAVGKSTANALERLAGRRASYPPDAADSEGLLGLEGFQPGAVRGARIIIVRGEGGRETLGRELRARGAVVTYLEVYRRVRPVADAPELTCHFAAGEVDFVVVTSGDGLDNLLGMLGEAGREWLGAIRLVLVSQRLAERARQLGIESKPVVAQGASDDAVVAAIADASNVHTGLG